MHPWLRHLLTEYAIAIATVVIAGSALLVAAWLALLLFGVHGGGAL